MKVDSEIICRKEPYGVVCRWIGDQRHGTATIDGSTLSRLLNVKRVRSGEVVSLGGLGLRVLGMRFGEGGVGYDSWYVKLDSPHSELYALYREKAEKFLHFILRCEAAVRAFMLQPVEGEEMVFTKNLASRLL